MLRTFRAHLLRAFAFLLVLTAAASPASAKVTIAFWSQELGENFPHAFFTIRGTTDGGRPISTSYGFTAKSVIPAILMGNVPGRIDKTTPGYIRQSNVHFELDITDAQAAAVLRLVDDWGDKGDNTYNMNKRNCVHFIAEAARRAGLAVVVDPKLVKRPRSFLQGVAKANAGKVRVVEQNGKTYWPELGK